MDEIRNSVNAFFKLFDSWVMSIGLPNDVKPLGNITAEEYKSSLYNFYKKLEIDDTVSFRKWIESFYSPNEIDFDYMDKMPAMEWVRLYFKVMNRYLEKGIIK